MKVVIYIVLSVLVILVSCKSYEDSYLFNVESLKKDYQTDVYNYSSQDTVFDIKFSDLKNTFRKPKFLNQSNRISVINKFNKKSYILQFDYFGKIIDTLFSSEENEIIDAYCINLTDSLIILRTLSYNDFLNDSSIYRIYNTYPINYKLVNLITKQQSNILQLNSTFWTENFQKNIWLKNSKEVVINEYKRDEFGRRIDYIFKLNIQTNDTTFIDFGHYPSVLGNDLLYIYKNNIYIYNLNSNKKKSIYKIPRNKTLANLDWIPNSTDILISLWNNRLFDKFTGGNIPFDSKTPSIIISKNGKVLTKKYFKIYDDWK